MGNTKQELSNIEQELDNTKQVVKTVKQENKKILKEKVAAEKHLTDIENSNSYKIGRMITYLPRMVKKIIK